MLLASHRKSCFRIVIPASAAPAESYAAEELQRYIGRMAQVQLPIVAALPAPDNPALLVGPSTLAASRFPGCRAGAKGYPVGESYVLKSDGCQLLILGGTPRGTLYAVYELLERLGVRWWTPADEWVPASPMLRIPQLDVRVDPPLIYRATWYRNAMDADWQARQRLNAGTMEPALLQPRHGGMVRFAMDHSGHSYSYLVPTEKYFDTHPEYFCEVNGVRLRHGNQLCPTHPAVADIAAAEAARWLDATPGCNLVSVTQNDHGNWCTCRTCAAMIEKTGAPSGPTLHLANEVARRLAQTHPHALVDTFAYAWTQQAPRHIDAHPNVVVRVAPIGNCFGHPIRSCAANAACREAFRNWSRTANHLFVWHYVTDFFHYLTPFPNLPPLEEDLHFYLAHKVKGIFMQGNGDSLGGDMAELKSYLIARLLWDPTRHMAAVREEFLTGYYRAAAAAVEDYVNLFETAFAQAGPQAHLHLYRTLWDNHDAYLAQPVLRKARAILASARRAAADDPAVQERLDRIEAGLNYTELFYYERPGTRVLTKASMVCPGSPRRRALATRLFRIAERHGFTHYGEDYGRYTAFGELRRAWLESLGSHQVVRLASRHATAMVVPALGGRIVAYGPADGSFSCLGVSSRKTFGYPCAGGYEEYTERVHQSPGFSNAFRVGGRTRASVRLTATLDTGLALTRRITLRAADASLGIRSTLANPHDQPVQGCLRAHLEITLDTPVKEIQVWLRRDATWEPLATGERGPAGTWFENQVPDGWFFWSPSRQRGVWQKWPRAQVGAVFLGTIPGEPAVLALDLARSRHNEAVAPGASQTLAHRFGWSTDSDLRGLERITL